MLNFFFVYFIPNYDLNQVYFSLIKTIYYNSVGILWLVIKQDIEHEFERNATQNIFIIEDLLVAANFQL